MKSKISFSALIISLIFSVLLFSACSLISEPEEPTRYERDTAIAILLEKDVAPCIKNGPQLRSMGVENEKKTTYQGKVNHQVKVTTAAIKCDDRRVKFENVTLYIVKTDEVWFVHFNNGWKASRSLIGS